MSTSPTFYSNAERAVENIKQNKATAEQWKAMLTKAGGIKSGEDKWMGLSQWLEENKREIAFVVPNVEPYQVHDEVHFGPENQGKAVMWVRFGETKGCQYQVVTSLDDVVVLAQ